MARKVKHTFPRPDGQSFGWGSKADEVPVSPLFPRSNRALRPSIYTSLPKSFAKVEQVGRLSGEAAVRWDRGEICGPLYQFLVDR
jgi:hypothetical protein